MTSVCMKNLSEINFAQECKITAINPRGAKTYFVSNEHLTKHDIDRVTSRDATKYGQNISKIAFAILLL